MKNPLIALTLLLTTLLPSGCGQPEEPVPPTKLLPREQMISVLIDMHLTEARVEATRMRPDSARALFRQQTGKLYWRHNTSDEIFRESMRYYAIHGKDLEQIYAAVVDSINKRQAQLTQP